MAVRSALLENLTLPASHLSSKQLIPGLIYGTAWKKEATADLVYNALTNGFRGIDTANQPKHYREDLVGEGLARALREHSTLKRSDIYIQTKFTAINGQDPNNIPYDPRSSLTEQVKQSVEISLKRFDVSSAKATGQEDSYIDAVVLHSPMSTIEETLSVWTTLESYVPGRILNLGISNVNLPVLKILYDQATVKPAVVQNRFYPSTRYDVGLRRFCNEKGIIYQSFWTLTANPQLLRSQPVAEIARNLQITPQAALYVLVLGLGNTTILDGTTNVQHMKDDHAAVTLAREFATSQTLKWRQILTEFRTLIGET